jgi:bis(5'-nucleosyl)-tetraphosphatase (symmetrical)
MATYFIGDVQGCFDELSLLLAKINFNHDCDTLYLTGDLIGRGPKALQTLEFLSAHQDSIKTVLGNHDLHFLAIACGIQPAKAADKFDQLLASPRLGYFVDYLRHQPLLIELPEQQLILTHAGLSPQWDVATAKNAAKTVEEQLQQPKFKKLLRQMYSNKSNNWPQCDTKKKQSIYAINALTRMRYCYSDGSLNFSQKCAPARQQDSQLAPWFNLPNPALEQVTVVFGHWASLLGQTSHRHAIGLDTGCLWGNHLSAWCLETQQLTQQPALNLAC